MCGVDACVVLVRLGRPALGQPHVRVADEVPRRLVPRNAGHYVNAAMRLHRLAVAQPAHREDLVLVLKVLCWGGVHDALFGDERVDVLVGTRPVPAHELILLRTFGGALDPAFEHGAVDIGELEHGKTTRVLVIGTNRGEEVPSGGHVVVRVKADERTTLFLGELDARLQQRGADPLTSVLRHYVELDPGQLAIVLVVLPRHAHQADEVSAVLVPNAEVMLRVTGADVLHLEPQLVFWDGSIRGNRLVVRVLSDAQVRRFRDLVGVVEVERLDFPRDRHTNSLQPLLRRCRAI
jgi:hypothetical protein